MFLKKFKSFIKKGMIGYQGKSASAERKLFRSDDHGVNVQCL